MLSKGKNNEFKNPFKDSLKAIAFPLFAIVVAIFVSVFFVMWAKGYGITEYFSALGDLFSTIWNGSFGDTRKTLETMVYVTPLIFTGIANAIAFKCGLFNIGVEGQFVMGMISASLLGLIPGLSPVIHIPLIIIGGIIAGGIWGGIPGYLKAKMGTSEVINTIMMNYLGLYLANYIILRTRFSVKGQSNTPLIQKSAELLRFSDMSRANVSIIIGILVAILIYWLFWKTTVGYEIRAVGINPSGAEYGGINIAKNIALAMILSGAIAGIGGATHIAGVMHQSQDMMALPGFGFDGMAVALLAKNNPIGCIPSAILFGALNSSSKMLQLNGIPKEIVYLIQSIVIIFVATDYIVKYFSERKKRKVLING
ncbi:ABC transporter permease [Clostridium thailandense]|uniref:ABC transporter permease n=1 Tax=Clostridium thailandense TaxID=2794346 RepID=A0A949TYW1_9CLOT|nr:ABC transporter permease [Clostridium thailandense]MBV7274150.1 ABC transporter permease [Clostridium thailandense]